MAKVRDLYARFSLNFIDHPKIAILSDRAFRTLFEMIVYSRRQTSDGVITVAVANKLWKAAALRELQKNHAERPSIFLTGEGYRIHDFEDYQTTSDEIEAKRNAGQKGGMAKAAASKDVAPASKVQEQKASTSLAKTETETETETETTSTDVEVVAPRATRTPAKTTRGSRIPEPFTVTPEMVAWARERVPGLDGARSTEKFVNHFKAAPGAKGVKVDWIATWHNWLLGDYDKGQNMITGSARPAGGQYQPIAQIRNDSNRAAAMRAAEREASANHQEIAQ